MKRLKRDKVKRGRIILSAVLTMLTAIISLGFGAYLGYVTLSINYITIGTMTPTVGGLLVVAGFFIFFGCVGGVISLKEIFISSRNEEKFAVYKPALISAMVYYVIIGIISIIGIIVALISFLPGSYTWTIVGLALVAILLCGGAFYLVLKEMKEHKKKAQGSAIANMNLSAEDIHQLSCAQPKQDSDARDEERGSEKRPSREPEGGKRAEARRSLFGDEGADEPFASRHLYEKYIQPKPHEDVDFVALAERLMQLEELRKAGLINDQEYQALKRRCIE